MPPEPAPAERPPSSMAYALRLTRTSDATGYFAAVPAIDLPIQAQLAYARTHPLDEFMHRHLLRTLAGFSAEKRDRFFADAGAPDPVTSALAGELAALDPRWAAGRFSGKEAGSPLIDLRSEALEDQPLHRRWSRLFAANLETLAPLPAASDAGLSLPFTEAQIAEGLPLGRRIETLRRPAPFVPPEKEPFPEEITEEAERRLAAAGIFEGGEMRHETSLSPVGLLRQWRFDVSVRAGRLDYRFFGVQTSYGRGFSVETARVRCLMEIVERASAFVGVEDGRVVGRRSEMRLHHGALDRMRQATGTPPLDPNRLGLEAPYEGEPLYWIEGHRSGRDGPEPILVPFQSAALFANLDEICLFSGLSSTGLAAGTSLAGARLSALVEVVERDSEAMGLFDPLRCFRLTAEDRFIAGLLDDYRARGIDVFFQDITGFSGIPCYKALVRTGGGCVVKGTGAHLDGRYALLSALTEVPYPYPNGPASGRGPENLPLRRFEALPNVSTGSADRDLLLAETVLLENGYTPVYVELTRADLQFPVVRALVPGLALAADFDRFTRLVPRHFAAYRAAAGGGRKGFH